jgi:hypothetical protein
MTLTLRPPGRGNWATVILEVKGRRAPPPMYFSVGQLLTLGGQVFRIAGVRP